MPKIPARCYINGETHLYLGGQYRLKLVEGAKNGVELSRYFFHITTPNPSKPESVKKLLNKWYRANACTQFQESMARCWPKFSCFSFAQPTTAIRKMRKRWGSFSSKGIVTLNVALVKAPKECIDYVMTHELCHLKHPNHSRQFYQLLASILPDWEKLRHKLEFSMV